MARQWVTFDAWEGGGFFASGSFGARDRFDALNMQRYQNGSIGPRPGWRKMTQSADASSSVPTTTTKANLQHGTGWGSWAPSGWSYGALFLPSTGSGNSRRVRPAADGTVTFYSAADIGDITSTDIRHDGDAAGIGNAQFHVDGSNPMFIGGSVKYDASAPAKTLVTPRTISASSFYPNKLVLYKNRHYGFQPLGNTALEEYIVYSASGDHADFNGTDSGDFRLSVATSGFEPAVPRGLWALGSGLLIFSSEGVVRQSTQYSGVVTNYADFGRWYMLTGQNISVGSLQPIDFNVGPLFYSLSIVFDGRVLFPIYQRGWASHDGSALDVKTLDFLRPGKGQYANGSLWLNPVQTHSKRGLVLPFVTSSEDPTGDGTYGEYWNTGYGAYEFVNGAWTESLYLHGEGDIGGYSNFEHDKLVSYHMDSSDGGTTWFPQFYTRDITLDRPATTSQADTYNPWSGSTETAPDNAGGATGDVEHKLTTSEWSAPDFTAVEVEAIVIDFDYWNGELFDSECGFEVDLILRGNRNNEKIEQVVTTTRVTPAGTSTSYVPKRDRAYLNLGARIPCGTFQVRIRDLKDVAIHAISVAIEPKPGLYV